MKNKPKTPKVTRELQADWPTDDGQARLLNKLFHQTNILSNRIWDQFGGLALLDSTQYPQWHIAENGDTKLKKPTAKTIDTATNRTTGKNNGFRDEVDMSSQIEQATLQDVLNDIYASQEAAKTLVRKKINEHYDTQKEMFVAYRLLTSGKYLGDSWLHKQMRKHCKHGRRTAQNNFTIPGGAYYTEIIDNRLNIVIKQRKKDGPDIRLITSSSGKNVDFFAGNKFGCNLRIMQKDDRIRILYTITPLAKHSGSGIVGIDKGYTSVFADSNGNTYGHGLGILLGEFSTFVLDHNKNINRMRAKIKKLRDDGDHSRADRMQQENMGRKYYDKKVETFQAKIKQLVALAVKELFTHYAHVVVEDLSWNKKTGPNSWGKSMNFKINMWTKGVIQKTLEDKAKQYDVKLTYVNAAYTSQIDSNTGKILSNTSTRGRHGKIFKHENGKKSDADVNAAKNILVRCYDEQIKLYQSPKKVKNILMNRMEEIKRKNILTLTSKYIII